MLNYGMDAAGGNAVPAGGLDPGKGEESERRGRYAKDQCAAAGGGGADRSG